MMDFQTFLDMLSGRPTNGVKSVRQGMPPDTRGGQDNRTTEYVSQPPNSELQARAQDRQQYVEQINAPPPPPNNDLYAILQRNLANPEVTPDHQALAQAGQEYVGQAQDIAANAQSDYAAAQMTPPLQTLGPQEVTRSGPPMWGFQPDTASAAPQQAPAQKSIEFLGLPPATPRPPPPGPMPQMDQMSKTPPFVPDFNRIPPMGPSVAGQDFIPHEVLMASRQPQPIAPLRPQPQGTIIGQPPVIGPGGAGTQLPFIRAPEFDAPAPAPAEPLLPIQQNGWLQPPPGAPQLQPRQMPPQAPAQPMGETESDRLNRDQLQQLLASFNQPPASQPPPMAAAPTPPEPRTVPGTSNQNPNIGQAKMNQAMPQILKDQLLLEAQRLSRRGAA
jgi:hypothetical protein